MLIGDNNPLRDIDKPIVTWAIMAVCVVVFVLQSVTPPEMQRSLMVQFALFPGQFYPGFADQFQGTMPGVVRLVSYQFMHGDLMHLLGNLLALWVVGNNVEDAMGHVKYLGFYLLGGIAAAFGQIWFDGAPFTPMVGASGSISALFAAYLLMHPFQRFTMIFYFIPVTLPAIGFFAIWIAQQVFGLIGPPSNVAFWAHLGGFTAGLLLTPVMKNRHVAFDRLFAWADVVHRTPLQRSWRQQQRTASALEQKRWAEHQRVRTQRQHQVTPQQAAFKADYRLYLDSMLSRQAFEQRWGQGALQQGKPTLPPEQWPDRPYDRANAQTPIGPRNKRASLLPSVKSNETDESR